MGIIGDKLQQKIETNNNIRYSDTIAEITYYDIIRNIASIRFTNPNSGSIMTANNIPVKINGGGLTQAALQIGQKCWITFIGNSLLCPVITNLCDDLYYDNIYSKKTNSDQGAYLIDSNINNIDIESIEVIPMTNDYFNNSIIDKYSLTKDYTNTEAFKEARNMLMQIDKYKASEDGITNIKSNSTVKFKDNGDIDIFVSNNVGIRISDSQHKISLYGIGIDINGIELNEEILKSLSNISNNNIQNNDNENTNNNNINISDIIALDTIKENIKAIDIDITEIEKIIELIIQITGNPVKFEPLKNKIEEYKEYKNTLSALKTSDEIKNFNNNILEYKYYFNEELNSAQGIL